MFHLRPPVLALGYAYLSSLSLADLAQDHLQQLCTEVQESCSASVLDDGDIVHIARAASDRIMAVRIILAGASRPTQRPWAAWGPLAGLPATELDAYFATYERAQLNTRTSTDERALRKILNEVRRTGFAVVDQELENGIRSVAVPIRDSRGAFIAAVNVSAHTSRVTLTQLRGALLRRLQATAADIENDLIAARRC